MEDCQIVSLFLSRDQAAIDQTQKKYSAYLHKIAYNILADLQDSEESVNDTYLAAWDSIPPNHPAILSTYLGKLTRRISIDKLRCRTAQKRGGGEYVLCLEELSGCAGPGTPEEALELQALADAIATFLTTQSKQTRQVFIARYYYMDPMKEIARYCGITESKAKVLLHRTRQALRDYLRQEGFSL